MSESPDRPAHRSHPSKHFGITRRNLAAAAAVLMAGLSSRSRTALADPKPKKRKRHHLHCFRTGTRIATPSGDVLVEHLAVGDVVLTHGGDAKQIRRIGRRTARKQHTAWAPDDVPVLIRKSALADDLPRRDLYVSKGHAIFCDGDLIPAHKLINGVTIVEYIPVGTTSIEYIHIDVGRHDVVFAEGAPCETLRQSGENVANSFDRFDADMSEAHQSGAVLFAPIVGSGYRHDLKSRLRSAASPLIDLRTRYDRTRDRIEARAEGFHIC